MGTERGFTFVEVLVTMLVLSFGVLGVLQTTLLAARLERRSAAVTAATFLAQERVERVGALGWDRATAALAVAPLPAELGGGAFPSEEVARPGVRYLLVYEREPGPVDPALCLVRCYWNVGGTGWDARNVVRFSLRRRR
ncbi:MAG TPA: prepilin-type N-terminal cleavage/methylation domain-containing protein [Candidatus Methanoperedens sp.]|nr:prepilin-type N-terminal cleavage/methylation domain-containing protein [Candidatus Methanoperedens sp.]